MSNPLSFFSLSTPGPIQDPHTPPTAPKCRKNMAHFFDDEAAATEVQPDTSPFKKRVFEAMQGNTDPLERSMQAVKRALKTKDPETALSPTSQGASGFTFLGQTTAKHIFSPEKFKSKKLQPDTPVGFVLKWVPSRDAANELACTQLSHSYGLEAPAIQPLDMEVSSLFVSPTKHAKPAFTPEPFQLLIMNRMRGMNLVELCKQGVVFTLDESSWQKMMSSFGNAAMFDLFIGNIDRFIRFETDGEGKFILAATPEANPGNVMLEATPEKRRTLSRISFIDNATPLIQEERPLESTGFSGKFLSLFGDETAASMEEPVEEPSTPVKANAHIVTGLHSSFVQMVEITKKRPDILAEHITQSVFNALKNVLIEELDLEHNDPRLTELFAKISAAKGMLCEGLQHGLHRLHEGPFQTAAQEIIKSASPELQRLVNMNLEMLRSN